MLKLSMVSCFRKSKTSWEYESTRFRLRGGYWIYSKSKIARILFAWMFTLFTWFELKSETLISSIAFILRTPARIATPILARIRKMIICMAIFRFLGPF